MKSHKEDALTTSIEFPALMIDIDEQFIVLFTSIGKGMVVYSDHPKYNIGHFSTDFGQQYFKPYYGTVHLTQ